MGQTEQTVYLTKIIIREENGRTLETEAILVAEVEYMYSIEEAGSKQGSLVEKVWSHD